MSLEEIAQDMYEHWPQYGALTFTIGYTIASAISKYRTNEWKPWTTRLAIVAGIVGALTLNHIGHEIFYQKNNTNQVETPVIEQLDDKAANLYPGNEHHNNVYYLRD